MTILHRRHFLKAALGLLAAPLVGFAPRPYHHPDFGKYLGHSVRRSEGWEEMKWGDGVTTRYLQWPVEVVLETRFERATLKWFNFNASRDFCNRLERMKPQELFAGVDWVADYQKLGLSFRDEVSAVWELDPRAWSRLLVPGKLARFSLASLQIPY